MPKIDAYLRSIERFGATGALLQSGQSITLRFPTGDRHATQVTPHELLVAMIREVAPPAAWSTLDGGRPARFELDSGGGRFSVSATPQSNAWQVAIEVLDGVQLEEGAPVAVVGGGASGGSSGAVAAPSRGRREPERSEKNERGERGERGERNERLDDLAASLAIERTPYDDLAGGGGASLGAGFGGGPGGSGSLLLDQLLAWARGKKASDLVLAAGAVAQARVDGRWIAAEEHPQIDGELLARELGVLAPASARAAWSERGDACFGADDASGRLRVQLGRDASGPRAAIRLLLAEPPAAERLGVPEAARRWLRARRGLVLVAGGPGSGVSTTWASLVRELAHAQLSVVTVEEPIELRQRPAPGLLVSQREAGAHVPTLAAGVRSAMREGADVIAVGRGSGAETWQAIAEAVAAGHLVIAAVAAATSAAALARLGEPGPGAASLVETLADALVGLLLQELVPRADGGGRLAAFEVVPGGPELAQVIRARRWELLPELLGRERGAGAQSLRDAVADLARRGYVATPA